MQHILTKLQNTIKNETNLSISSKPESSAKLNMSSYSGVVEYYPEELVITVKAGTKVQYINNILAKNKQSLSFLTNNDSSSIGALYATGNSNLADSVLGVQIIDGNGDLLNFGGQVMKNVAGYDVSRLLVGSKGKLALITQISLKVLPQRYINNTKDYNTSKPSSIIRKNIEAKLKKVFDPKGIFI